MSDNKQQSNHVDIPARRWPWTPVDAPSERVHLPLKARARIGLLGVLVSFVALMSLVMLLFLPSFWLRAASGKDVLICAMTTMTALLILPSFGAFCTLLVDRFGSRQNLIISGAGLEDQRTQSGVILWTNVNRVKFYYSRNGIDAVRLSLKEGVHERINIFRVGSLFHLWRRTPNEIHIPLRLLDNKARRLAIAIAVLSERHGSSTDYNTVVPPELL